jgi:hypothetical protein
VILSVAGLFLIFFALARTFRETPPAVAQNSVLQLQLSGDIPERPPVEVPFGAFADRPATTVASVWMMLRKAAVDSRVKAVVLEPESLSVGWGKRRPGAVQEIRQTPVRFSEDPGQPRVLSGLRRRPHLSRAFRLAQPEGDARRTDVFQKYAG